MRSGRSSTGCWTINSPISARHRLTWRSFLMEKRTAIKIINAAGLMSLVLFAVFWQPGVTAATKGPRTERVADANGNLRVPADYRTAYQFLGSWAVATDQGQGSKDIHVVYASP